MPVALNGAVFWIPAPGPPIRLAGPGVVGMTSTLTGSKAARTPWVNS